MEPDAGNAAEGKRNWFLSTAIPKVKMQGMEITVNSQPKTVNEQVSLLHLLEAMNFSSQKGVAVAVNQTVIPKAEWTNYFLKQNDNVLIIKASQGG